MPNARAPRHGTSRARQFRRLCPSGTGQILKGEHLLATALKPPMCKGTQAPRAELVECNPSLMDYFRKASRGSLRRSKVCDVGPKVSRLSKACRLWSLISCPDANTTRRALCEERCWSGAGVARSGGGGARLLVGGSVGAGSNSKAE